MLAVKLAVPILFVFPAALIGGSTTSSVALSSSPNPSVLGRPVTLTAVVAPPTASGSVTFYDGTAVLGIATLTAGQATLTTILLPSGVGSLRAYYGGDANYALSTSATLVQTVNAVQGGDFQAIASYDAGANPYSVAVGDFNGDGRADLVVANLYVTDLSVLLGKGDGTFQAAADYGAGGSHFVAVGDFDGDGNADLAVANYSIGVLLGNGDGTFQAPMNYAAGSSPASMAVGDFNGDGKADLAAATESGVSVLLGNGDGTFKAPMSYAAGTSPPVIAPGVNAGSIAVGDFNGDGKADLAVANYKDNNVSVLLANGDGTFQASIYYAAGAGPVSIAVGDFNSDGKVDLVTANDGDNNYYSNNGSGGVSVLLGNGDGTFRTAENYGAGYVLKSVAVGDFNGDGRADLVAANYDGNVSVFFGNGDGTFQAAVNYGAGDIMYSVAVGNFNGDGRTDLVTANGADVNVLLGLAPAPELSVAITHAGNFTQGQSGATYAINVSNVGYVPTSGTVTVTDSLPAGFAATNISGTGWTCVLGTLTCTREDPLARFTSYPAIVVTVNVAVGASGGATNTVSASGGGEISLANAGASDFVTTFTPRQSAQTWSSLNPPAPLSNAAAALLMTDGTVVVHQWCSSNWYRLAPDAFGSYATGTWSQVAAMPAGYGPGDFSSAVLADGRLVVIGGEYNISGTNNACMSVDTNLGAIYDPTTNIWTPLSAPNGWTQVGDAQNAVLPEGRFLLASLNYQLGRLDSTTLTWTILNGTGKADRNDEEGWTLLPDGSVLTVDVLNGTQSERYLPLTDSWVPAGTTISQLASGGEMGPQVLRPNGSMFVIGASGHTSVYDVGGGIWAAGPDLPISDAMRLFNNDGPASLLPSGNVLVTAFNAESNFFFEFDGTHLNPAPAPPGGNCYELLSLPTGQVLCTSGSNINFYTPTGNPDPAWAPTIVTAPSVVQPGLTYSITGTQFNGLSQAVGYGDDYQGATNYPLVRITNAATLHVFYCRTHNHSTMGVATGSAPVSTQFDVPPSIETGPSTLVVVANGIPSKPWSLTVSATQSASGPMIQGVEGAGLSVPAVKALSANGFFTVFGVNLAPAGTSRNLASSDIVNGLLPTNLASTCVIAGSVPAFLTYVSSTQINGIASSLPITGSAAVSVVASCGAPNQVTSPAVNVPVAAASPEFLYWAQNANGQDPVVAVDAVHGEYIGPPGLIPGLTFRPAVAGEILTIYGIGFGQTASGPVPGLIPSTADSVPSGYSVTIGGTTASASYVGVTPGDAGLYQVNVTIPAGIAPGNYPIILNVNGVSTPAGAFLAIGP